jgi:magnesium transporter
LNIAPAPSQKLLRFLRAQSEGLAFFTGSPECAPLRRTVALPRARSHHGRLTPNGARPRRPLNMPAPGRNLAVLQAGLVDVSSILPRALLRRSRTTAAAAESKGSRGLVPLAAGTTRSASSGQSPREDCAEECRPRWRDWLFGPSQKRRQQLKEDDLRLQMEEESGSIFQRRSLASKAALDPRLRCTEVAGNGEVIMVDGELKKSELIAKVGGVCGYGVWLAVLMGCVDSTVCFLEIFERLTRPTSRTFWSGRRRFCSTFFT